MSYYRLTLLDRNGNILWTIPGTYSLPLAAGLVVALDSILEGSDNYDGQTYEIRFFQMGAGRKIDRDVLTNVAWRFKHQGRFYPDQVTKTLSDKILTNYGVWIINIDGWMILYEFDSEEELKEFLQGVLTMIRAFNTVPIAVLQSPPLLMKEYLQIEGVDLPLLPE